MPGPARVRDPQSFDHLVEHADRVAVLLDGQVHSWLSLRLPGHGERAVDLGCGTGVHTRLLAERYAEVLAVDVCAAMLEHARTHRPHPNVRYEQRDLTTVTAGRDGRFDLVFTAYTLHHLPDLAGALVGLRELVRPGGRLVALDMVDERPAPVFGDGRPACVPRRWFRNQALRTFGADLAGHRHSPREALELLRLRLDPAWLDHLATDRLLPAAEWEAVSRTVLPRAEIAALHRARAVHWTAR
jgi:trans-aconitate methyltransferase